MADDNNIDQKGFSGLSDLVSEVGGIDEPIKPEPMVTAEPTAPGKVPQPQQEDPFSESIQADEDFPPSNEPKGSSDSGGSGGKWILGIIGVISVIWLINSGDQSNKKPSYSPPSSSQRYSYPQSPPAPAVQTPRTTQSAGLQYTKPSVGTNNVLSVPEIRWCIREGIRIEAIRDVIDTNAGIDKFNRIVNDYNNRCGNYQFRLGSQSQAERDVEPYRSQIATEAIREARQLGSSYEPSYYPTTSPGVSSSTAPKKPNAKYTREAQRHLTDLGYNPGPVDGNYGRRTADAVREFQRNIGITQNGWVDEDLLSILRRTIAAYKPPVVSQPRPQIQTSIQPRSSTPSATTTEMSGYFTRGSHQDDVLRVQGTPDYINNYKDRGYEEWNYGYSSVNISTQSRRVISWMNQGNLKIQISPGSNTTYGQYFTHKSHQDEVLRLQGMPDDINEYPDLGYEDWMYGYSSVRISTRDRRVVSWDNYSGNIKAR